jgi:transcriptional regulator with XRE-family HTH domain
MEVDDERGELANLVREARARVGLSQRDVARAVGVTNGAIGQLETGTGKLSREKLERLGDVLSMPDDAVREMLFLAAVGEPGRGPETRARTDVLVAGFASIDSKLTRLLRLVPGVEIAGRYEPLLAVLDRATDEQVDTVTEIARGMVEGAGGSAAGGNPTGV